LSGLGSMLQVCHNVSAHSSGSDTFCDYVRIIQFLKLLGDGYKLLAWYLGAIGNIYLQIFLQRLTSNIT